MKMNPMCLLLVCFVVLSLSVISGGATRYGTGRIMENRDFPRRPFLSNSKRRSQKDPRQGLLFQPKLSSGRYRGVPLYSYQSGFDERFEERPPTDLYNEPPMRRFVFFSVRTY